MSRKLTAKQLKAAYLLAEGSSRYNIARSLKTREETISRWRKIPEFIMEYERIIEEIRAGFKNRLTILVDTSMDAIQGGIRYDSTNQKRLEIALNVIKTFGKDA